MRIHALKWRLSTLWPLTRLLMTLTFLSKSSISHQWFRLGLRSSALQPSSHPPLLLILTPIAFEDLMCLKSLRAVVFARSSMPSALSGSFSQREEVSWGELCACHYVKVLNRPHLYSSSHLMHLGCYPEWTSRTVEPSISSTCPLYC